MSVQDRKNHKKDRKEIEGTPENEDEATEKGSGASRLLPLKEKVHSPLHADHETQTSQEKNLDRKTTTKSSK